MATFNDNSSSKAGWEITPYTPLPILNGPMDIAHQRKENSIIEIPVGETKKIQRRRTLVSAKIRDTSSVYFKFFKYGEDPLVHALAVCDNKSSPDQLEEGMISMEHLLPVPGLLQGWMKETRERPNGKTDKFYFHASSTKTFRSVIEVVEHIKSKNNLEDVNEDSKLKKLKLHGAEWVKLSKASSSMDKKRKNNGNQQKLDSKKRRSLLGACAEKTPEQIVLEKFFADVHTNLLNVCPPTTEAMTAENKSAVEAFFAEAQENLLRAFEGEEKGRDTVNGSCENDLTPEEIEEIINELIVGNDAPQLLQNPEPTNLKQNVITELQPNPDQQAVNPEQLNPEKEGVINGLTEKEMEVVQIFTEGLDIGKDYQLTKQDLDRIMPYSPPIFDPVDQDFL